MPLFRRVRWWGVHNVIPKVTNWLPTATENTINIAVKSAPEPRCYYRKSVLIWADKWYIKTTSTQPVWTFQWPAQLQAIIPLQILTKENGVYTKSCSFRINTFLKIYWNLRHTPEVLFLQPAVLKTGIWNKTKNWSPILLQQWHFISGPWLPTVWVYTDLNPDVQITVPNTVYQLDLKQQDGTDGLCSGFFPPMYFI